MKTVNFDELKNQINEWVRLDYINPEDIPAIELYMDQITTFMDEQLNDNKRSFDEKVMTKTMINNYSKNDLLPPSNKKKYTKDHVIILIYIYYLKNFLSINDIQSLIEPMNDQYFHAEEGITMHEIYKDLFQLEKEYGIKVRDSINEVYDIAQQQFADKDDYLKTFAMIAMLSYDIYEKKQVIEHLIDSIRQNYEKVERKSSEKGNKKKSKK